MAQVDARPPFEVEKLQGPHKRRIATKSKDGRSFEYREDIDKRPHVAVYFLHGHSIKITEKRAEELGFLDVAPDIDATSGEAIPGTLKHRVMNTTKQRIGQRRDVDLGNAGE